MKSMVVGGVCWPKDCEVLLMVLDLMDDEGIWEFLMLEVMLRWGLMRVLLRLFWVREEFECLGRSGAIGKMCVGNS